MNNVTSLAVDLAKNVFQLHGTDVSGKLVIKKKISREKLSEFVANLHPCNIFMEGCGSANYWGKRFESMGHNVKLINPKYVKPYVKRNKNDINDAAGIAAAARDPDMRFSKIKNEAQQDVQSVHRIRSLLVQQRTAMINQTRGLLAERGIIMPKNIYSIRRILPEILDREKDMSILMQTCLKELYENLKSLDEKIAVYDQRIESLFKGNELCKKLATIPGVGVLGATILASVLGNGALFKNGRHFAAFLGLTPKQYSSGGKEKLLGISKGGDTYIRSLLIHGARAVMFWVNKKTDAQSKWIKCLMVRRGNNKAAVALANKIARTAWALSHGNMEYNPNYRPMIKATGSLATAL